MKIQTILGIKFKTILCAACVLGLILFIDSYWNRYEPEKINAYALVILVIITFFYTRSTNLLLKEQKGLNRVSEIKYRLENLYSPSEILALNYYQHFNDSLTSYKLNKFTNEFMDGYKEILIKYSYMALDITGYVNKIGDEFKNIMEKNAEHGNKLKNDDEEIKLKEFMEMKVNNTEALRESVIDFLSYTKHIIGHYNEILDSINEDKLYINVQQKDIRKIEPEPTPVLEFDE